MTADRIVEELVSNQATSLCRPGFKSIPGGGSLASGNSLLAPAVFGRQMTVTRDVLADGVKTLRDAYYSSLKDQGLEELKKNTLGRGFD